MKKLINVLETLPEWVFLLIYLGTLFCYKTIVSIQGFDMCDEGWVLSAYQQIFNDPTACEYQFLYYNTLLVGGLWNLVFGSLGYFGFRLLGALFSTAIAYLVYLMLRKEVNRWCIFVGIMLFNLGYGMVFHHNWMAAFGVALSALFLYKGLSASNKWWVLSAGIMVGSNIFSRIPNVSMFSLVLVFIPYYLYTKNFRATLRLILSAIIGVIIGIGIEMFLIYSLGHFDAFVDSITSGFSAASAGDSTHSLSRTMGIYKGNYDTIFKQLAFFLSVPMYVYFANKLIHNEMSRKIILWTAAAFYFLFIWKMAESTFMIYGICYLVYCVYVLKHPQDKNAIYLISIASIILFFLPFGSDYGVGNMGSSCIWIATPLAMGLIYKLLQERDSITYRNARIFVCVFILALAGKTVYSTSLNCYFDHGSRLKKTARPQAALATTYTSPEKAAQIDTLMVHLQPLVKKNDYLLCYQCISTINYLTETRPYLGNSWPWTYTALDMEHHFKKSKETIPTLPVIVRNKSGIASWEKPSKDWDNTLADDQWNFNTRKIELIQGFIRDNDYSIHWENDLFQILIPATQKNK